jgi:hypothetical protein
MATHSSSLENALMWAIEHNLDEDFEHPVAHAVAGALLSEEISDAIHIQDLNLAIEVLHQMASGYIEQINPSKPKAPKVEILAPIMELQHDSECDEQDACIASPDDKNHFDSANSEDYQSNKAQADDDYTELVSDTIITSFHAQPVASTSEAFISNDEEVMRFERVDVEGVVVVDEVSKDKYPACMEKVQESDTVEEVNSNQQYTLQIPQQEPIVDPLDELDIDEVDENIQKNEMNSASKGVEPVISAGDGMDILPKKTIKSNPIQELVRLQSVLDVAEDYIALGIKSYDLSISILRHSHDHSESDNYDHSTIKDVLEILLQICCALMVHSDAAFDFLVQIFRSIPFTFVERISQSLLEYNPITAYICEYDTHVQTGISCALSRSVKDDNAIQQAYDELLWTFSVLKLQYSCDLLPSNQLLPESVLKIITVNGFSDRDSNSSALVTKSSENEAETGMKALPSHLTVAFKNPNRYRNSVSYGRVF